MSGSSRSLSRSIASVFDNWANNKDWDRSPSRDIQDLHGTIYAYKERHNSVAALNSSLNSEIRATYSKFVKDLSEISKELLFLDILTRLSPVLSADEVKLWLATYLLPAIDSTGFDTRFASKAEEFVRSVAVNVHPTEDPHLQDRRRQIALMVAAFILRIYLGADKDAYGLIGLEYKEGEAKEQETHESIERKRFMERNCGIILLEFGQQTPKDYFVLLDRYFCVPEFRLKVLNLLSSFVAANSSQTKVITKTPLMNNLLICLARDRSETVIACALSLLLILMGRLCDSISSYIVKLFVIYARLQLWSTSNVFQVSSTSRDSDSQPWRVAESDMEYTGTYSQFFENDAFNLSYLTTLLYAFFPVNLINFSREPNKFFRSQSSPVLGLDCKRGLSTDIEATLTNNIQTLCEMLRLHPNFLVPLTPEEELQSPIKWVLDNHKDQDISEDDIMLECLKLNPTFLIWLPDNFVWPKDFYEKVHESVISRSSSANLTRSHSTKSILRTSHWAMTAVPDRSSIRGSIDLSHDGVTTPRHASIIPPSLLSEKSPNEPLIKFKNVDYTRPKGFPEGGSPRPKHSSQSTTDSLSAVSELFQAHERLYKMSNTRRNSQQIDAQNTSVAASGNFQQTTKSASAMLNEQLKGKKDEEVAPSKGGALDFYQRELLLYKNELQFTLYMVYLNKLNFIKLKAQLNDVLRERASKKSESNDTDHPPKLAHSIMASFEDLQKESQRSMLESKAVASKLSNRIIELQSKLDVVSKELQGCQEERDTFRQRAELHDTSMDALKKEINELQLKIKAEGNAPKATSKEDAKPAPSPEPTSSLSEHEQEIFNLKAELEMSRSRNNAVQRELSDLEHNMDLTVKTYERKLANLKLDLGSSVREHVTHYEKRMQELKATISRYSATIEEKNSLIAQLSTSRPIQIPGDSTGSGAGLSPVKPRNIPVSARQNGNLEYGTPFSRSNRPMQDYIDTRSSTGASVRSWNSSSSAQATPKTPQTVLRQPTSSSIPIMKGRGGYQKRSKRM